MAATLSDADLTVFEEDLIKAQKAARTLARAAALDQAAQPAVRRPDLWGTIKVNLEVLQSRCHEALATIKQAGR